ncbi:helix-turn-helix domain-containing protein [Paucilactobacillus nenjiangensis]|uniref:Helix-turn-helix transcriptional regulator n=1 Tax=Paucilactobacillus nenjiangensis TaxID=1296540 RepID=A0A5P1X3W8_9LACO|nr:helix-turn-helix transcriptional regulator [Paucilactobacillus nenjiangensis]QER67604.1 helix-turn-helix transcriptional regulator [Paucilactobacillus nenjiangensis]
MKYLKDVRKNLKLTQPQMAEKLNYSKSHYIQVENEFTKPSFEFLQRVFDLAEGKIDMNKFFQ